MTYRPSRSHRPRLGEPGCAARRTASRAFTLIELLIVIAILAVLAGLLFPVFARAREKSRQTACASNLKNLGLAILLYTQDHDGQSPLAAYATADLDFLTWHDIIEPYAKNREIGHCPSSPLRKADAGGKVTTHFGYNAHYLTTIAPDFSNASGHTGVSLAAVARPAEVVLLTDARASLQPSWCGDDGKFLLPPSQQDTHCWGRPNFLHDAGCTVLWVDGHVRWRKPDQFYSGQNPIDRFFAR